MDGVQSQDLRTFVNQSKFNSLVVVRYKHADCDSDLVRIGDRAKYYLEKKVPFDNAFNLFDSTSFYCSELLWNVFKDEFHIDIPNNEGKLTNVRAATFHEEYLPFVQKEIIEKLIKQKI